MKKSLYVLSTLAIAISFLVSCSGSKKVTKETPIQDWDAPKWVVKGSGAFDSDDGKVFYGVGSATNMENNSLLRSAADNRARNDLAKVFEFYSASIMKDYMASTSAGQANVTAEEQHVEQAIKTITITTLSGVEIVEHWQNPGTGELFSLAKLDLEAFKNNLERAKELNSRVKEYIRENADRLHKELEIEEEKRREI